VNKTGNYELKISLNTPNIITAVRVVLVIVIVRLLYLGGQAEIHAAGIILIVAALTDWLDGFLARKLGQTSLMGSLFDLVADEILFMPVLILAIATGLFSRTDTLMPWNPYPYAIPALAGGVTVLAGVGIYLWKRRKRVFEFPTPTGVAKVNYWFWLTPLIIAILGIGPDILLAVMMYLAIISTVLTFYSYLKKGSYVFTD
jgi:phosphatidylglycerophosphate synthase